MKIAHLFSPKVNILDPGEKLKMEAHEFLDETVELISDLFSTRVDTVMPGAGIVAEWIMEETGKLIVGTVELIGWGRNYYEDLEEE